MLRQVQPLKHIPAAQWIRRLLLIVVCMWLLIVSPLVITNRSLGGKTTYVVRWEKHPDAASPVRRARPNTLGRQEGVRVEVGACFDVDAARHSTCNDGAEKVSKAIQGTGRSGTSGRPFPR